MFEIPMSSRSYEFFLLKSLISTYNTSFLICIFIIFTNILLGSGIIWICNIFIFGCNFPSFFLPYCIFFSTFLLYFLIQNQYMTKTFHWIKKCCLPLIFYITVRWNWTDTALKNCLMIFLTKKVLYDKFLINLILLQGKWHQPFFEIFDHSFPLVNHFTK